MKCLHLIIALLCLSSVTISKRISKKSKGLSRVDPKNNVVYKFVYGFVETVSGDPKFIDECSKQIQGIDKTIEEQKSSAKFKQIETSGSIGLFDQMAKLLTKGIDYVCNFKEQIISFLSSKIKKYHRRFLQGKTKKKFKWDLSNMWNNIKTLSGDLGKSVVEGAKKVGKTVVKSGEFLGKKVEDLYKAVETNIKTIFQPLFDLFEKLKDTIITLFTGSPVLKKFMEYAQCFFLNEGIKNIKLFYETIRSFVTLVPKLTTPAGWIEVVTNMICGWESILRAINNLRKAFTDKDDLEKFRHYGKFIGHLFTGIVD